MVEKMFETTGMTHQEKLKRIGESYRTAYHFADKVFKKFPGVIKTIVLFGSVTKADLKKGVNLTNFM